MHATTTTRPARPLPTVFFTALLLGLSYSLALAYLERRLPIIPDYTALEVVGGVILTMLPVAFIARRAARLTMLTWQTYERMVVVAFLGTGLPVLIWQVMEFALRRVV
jgi:hypothetical protein